jgi:membrane peptidoglycan carboxypeptidase
VTPNPVWAVYDGETKLETPQARANRVVDAGATFTLTRMLQSVVADGLYGQYGTARMARRLSGLGSTVALAGKTGTGDNDLWFIGFTPRLVVVVWVGFDNNFSAVRSFETIHRIGVAASDLDQIHEGCKEIPAGSSRREI